MTNILLIKLLWFESYTKINNNWVTENYDMIIGLKSIDI